MATKTDQVGCGEGAAPCIDAQEDGVNHPLIDFILAEMQRPVQPVLPAGDPVVEALNRARIRVSEWEPVLDLVDSCGGLAEAIEAYQRRSMRRAVRRVARKAMRLLEKGDVKSGENRPRVGKRDASRTPLEFRDVLLGIARAVESPGQHHCQPGRPLAG